MVFVPLGPSGGAMFQGLNIGSDVPAKLVNAEDMPTSPSKVPHAPKWVGELEFEWRYSQLHRQKKRLPPKVDASPPQRVTAEEVGKSNYLTPSTSSLPKLQPSRRSAVMERTINGHLVPIETPPTGPEHLQARVLRTRERKWRSSIEDYDRGMGPDPVTMFILRKQRGKAALAPHKLRHGAPGPQRTRVKVVKED